jgi:small subunit ribosomal protein S6
MLLKDYETVFILNPVLSETETKDTVEKFKKVLLDQGAEFVNEELWGVRPLAYNIQKKTHGYYVLIEFKAKPESLITLEVEYRRDEKIIRFLTVALDKHAVAYNQRRRNGELASQKSGTSKKSDTFKNPKKTETNAGQEELNSVNE